MRFDLKSFDFVECERAPDALAVAAADRNLSWAQLRAEALAWADAACAARRRMPVAIYGHKQASFFVAMVGALLVGAPFVPVDTIYPPERLRRIVEIVRPAAVYDAAAGRFEPGHGAAGRTRPGLRHVHLGQHRRSEGRADRARAWACWATGCWAVSDWATRRCS